MSDQTQNKFFCSAAVTFEHFKQEDNPPSRKSVAFSFGVRTKFCLLLARKLTLTHFFAMTSFKMRDLGQERHQRLKMIIKPLSFLSWHHTLLYYQIQYSSRRLAKNGWRKSFGMEYRIIQI